MRIAAYLNINRPKTTSISLPITQFTWDWPIHKLLNKEHISIACYFQVYGVKLSYWFSSNMETFERYMESYDPNWKSDYTVLGYDIKRTLIMVPPQERWHEINGLQRLLNIGSRFMNFGSIKSNPFYWTEFSNATDINPKPIGPLPENPWFEKQMAEFNMFYDNLNNILGITPDKIGEPINNMAPLKRFNPYLGLNLPAPTYPSLLTEEEWAKPTREYFKFSNKKYRMPRKLKKRLKKNPKVIPEFNSKKS